MDFYSDFVRYAREHMLAADRARAQGHAALARDELGQAVAWLAAAQRQLEPAFFERSAHDVRDA